VVDPQNRADLLARNFNPTAGVIINLIYSSVGCQPVRLVRCPVHTIQRNA
jgi:hypothetical protein